MKTQFKIGDKVTIKKHGEIYTTYIEVFEQLGFKNKKENNNYFENKKDLTYVVFNSCPHPKNSSLMLYAIRDNQGNEILINEKGIKHKQYTVSKDFILEAHESACSTFKTKIENQFPELFPKVELELNKWYKSNLYGKKLYYFTAFKQGDGYLKRYYYGFSDDVFKKDYTASKDLDKSWTLATKEEVETALIAEAKKRGFKKGVTYIDTGGIKRKADYDAKFFHDYGKEGGYSLDCGDGKGLIFFNGKWAEIISEPIELSLEERVKNIEEQLKKLK